jgi:hypothetical protein
LGNWVLELFHHDTEVGAVDDDGFSLSAPSAALGVSLQTKWKINLDLGAQYVFANSDKLDMYEKNVSDSYLMPFIGLGYTFGGKEAKMTAKKVSSEMTSRHAEKPHQHGAELHS